MPDDLWFDVELSDLSLKPSVESGWPDGMAYVRSRMLEESLEILLATNMEALFPGECLRVVQIEDQLHPGADLVAIDPAGCMRIFELKLKNKTSESDLVAQALGYGLAQASEHPRAWLSDHALLLVGLPQRLSLGYEGFMHDVGAKTLGSANISDRTIVSQWDGLGWRARNTARLDELRARRGVDRSVAGVTTEGEVLLRRLWGTSAGLVEGLDPMLSAERLLQKWFGEVPCRSVEICMVAPGLASGFDAPLGELSPLARVLTNGRLPLVLVDADLRREERDGRTTAARLRWTCRYRWRSSERVVELVEFRRRVWTLNQEAARFGGDGCLHWGSDFLHLVIDWDRRTIRTSAHWLTEGLAALKPRRRVRLREIKTRLEDKGVHSTRKGDDLVVPFDPTDGYRAAVELAVEYHALNRELGPTHEKWACVP